MSSPHFLVYSQFEDGLVRACNEYPLHAQMRKMEAKDFKTFILQLGFFSENFVKFHEIAKRGLSPEAQETINTILRDEIPQNGPTHQDDRMHDLELMGISVETVQRTTPGKVVAGALDSLLWILKCPQKHRELVVLITLRVAYEVLVAEQYRHIINYAMFAFDFDPEQSRFFYPHYKHDKKCEPGTAETGHTEAYDRILESLITEDTLPVATHAARTAYVNRMLVHEEFFTMLSKNRS